MGFMLENKALVLSFPAVIKIIEIKTKSIIILKKTAEDGSM